MSVEPTPHERHRTGGSLMSGLSLALGGANVIMQLSRPAVGHGVIESAVESGSLHRHPVKRTRTTLGYVTIALFGTDVERAAMRREVDRQHRFVRSNDQSLVTYNAFDPELQLWVAACMYQGLVDATQMLYGPTSPADLDDLYRRSARFATTLQVPETMWPKDREAFAEYWSTAMELVSMDDATRAYLNGLASLSFLPWPLRTSLGPLHRFITVGFLPEPFRVELGLTWSPSRQRAFDRCSRAAARANRVLPPPARQFPLNLVLWDTRRRIRSGRPVV